jgi:hypothetical protein
MAGRAVPALILAAGVLAGCSSASGSAAPAPPTAAPAERTPGTSASTSATTPGAADTSTPDGVALVATRAWLSFDTRVDQRPNDTARRLALPWLAPGLRQEVESFTGAAAPGAEWADWTARHAWATVGVEPGGDDHPPDGPQTAWRQVLAVVTLHGDGGWTASQRYAEFLQLQLVDGRWLVADLRATDPVPVS